MKTIMKKVIQMFEDDTRTEIEKILQERMELKKRCNELESTVLKMGLSWRHVAEYTHLDGKFVAIKVCKAQERVTYTQAFNMVEGHLMTKKIDHAGNHV